MLQLPFLLLSWDESRTQARLETPPRQAGRGSPRTEQHTVDRANIYHAWKWQLSQWAMWPVTQRGAQGGKRAGCTPAQGDGELCCCHQVLLATRTPGLLSSVLHQCWTISPACGGPCSHLTYYLAGEKNVFLAPQDISAYLNDLKERFVVTPMRFMKNIPHASLRGDGKQA